MTEPQAEEGFAFTVIDNDGQDVTIEVSEDDENEAELRQAVSARIFEFVERFP